MNKFNYIFGLNFFLYLFSSAYAAEHRNLIHCEQRYSNCKLVKTSLESKQDVHSNFTVSYNMNCDPGASPNTPSSLRIVVETESGQENIKVINFKTNPPSYKVDGYGPIYVRDTDPNFLSSLDFNGDCNLNVNIAIKKSTRTINEEQNFLDKIDQFVSQSKANLNETFKLMVQYKADIFMEQKNKSALACTINKYQSDVLYEEIIDELKSKYLILFDEDFSSLECVPGLTKTIADNCNSDDISRSCVYKKAYFDSRKKILDISNTAKKYLRENSTKEFHDQLKDIVKKIDQWSGE